MSGKKSDDPLAMMDDLRLGLQYLDTEEENLHILKNHLSKIKKIREDQIRKDSIVELLQERVVVLEKDLATSSRQSAEIQEILTERITFLESAVKGKDELEFKYEELSRSHEVLIEQHTTLIAEYKEENNRCLEYKIEVEHKEVEISKCNAATAIEKQTISQLQVLFETLKTELIHKDDMISALNVSHNKHCEQLNQALNIANITITDLSNQLNVSEENVGRLTAAVSISESAYEMSKKDITHFDKELKLWKEMYAELEAVLLKVKGQLILLQQSHENELNALKSDLDSNKTSSARHKQDLGEVQTTIAAIAQDMKMIHTLEQQHKISNRDGSHSSLQNAQIMALAMSLQKIIGIVPGKTKVKKAHYVDSIDSNTSSNSSSQVVGIQSDISLIVQSICDMIYRIFALDEQESDLKNELKHRTESVQTTSAYCTRLEQSKNEVQDQLNNFDEAVRQLLEYGTQNRYLLKPSRGFDDEFGLNIADNDLRNAPLASIALKDSIYALDSEIRATLIDELYNILRSSFHAVTVLEEERSSALKSIQSLKTQHDLDIIELKTEHEKQIIVLEKQINELHRECDDAAIAVRFTEYESQNEISRMKHEFERFAREKNKGSNEEVEELKALLHNYHSRYTQVTLCFEHVLQYIAPLHKKLNDLQSVYSLSTALYRQLSLSHCKLINEIHEVAYTFSDVLDEDSGRVIVHPSTAVGGRPEASSRRQRHSRYHNHASSTSPNSKITGRVSSGYHHQRLTLRIVTLFILAVNRLRRFRVERKKSEYNASNLLAVEAAIISAKSELSPSKKHKEVHDFVIFYPAFPLPSVRVLTSDNARDVTEQLLVDANCMSSHFTGYDSSTNLLHAVKQQRSSTTFGLQELRDIKNQLDQMTQRLQLVKKPYVVAPESYVTESNNSLHIINNSSKKSSPQKYSNEYDITSSPVVNYRYSEFNDSSINVMRDTTTLFNDSVDLNITRNTYVPLNVSRGSRSSSSENDEALDSDLEELVASQYASSFPVFNDISSNETLNNTTTNEILEIYSDIGRLTGKLTKGFNATT